MSDILKKAENFVTQIHTEKLPQGCVYHNYTHVKEVVDAAQEIGENSGLSPKEMEMVLLAAWFHDTGISRDYENHEQASVEIARQFLKQNNYTEDQIEIVLNIILATRMPQTPHNILEEVLCDADIIHIGKKGYNTKGELLRAEWERLQNVKYTDIEWIKSNIDFISRNSFHTPYAKKITKKEESPI